MKIPVFSRRHARALRDGTLTLSLPRRLRGRIRKTFEKHDYRFSYQPDRFDRWVTETSVMEQVEQELCRIEGVDRLVADYQTEQRIETDLAGYIEGADPSGVLDAIEVFCSFLSDEEKVAFREDINQVFYEEESPWRLLDESVVKLDPSMLEAGSIDHTVETLRTIGLDGALEEFRDALDELTGGDPRDAIQDACNAYESVLQFVTDTGGSATELINEFRRLYLADLPQAQQNAIKKALQALPVLGNNMGRHGQGPEVIDVHLRYAHLAVRLAGGLILFLVDAYLAANPSPGSEPESPASDQVDPLDPSEAPF